MAMKIVKEFSFPADRGFTGSAGQTHVAGYKRGGPTLKAKKPRPKAPKVSPPRRPRAAQGTALPPPMPPPAPETAPSLGPLSGAGGLPPMDAPPMEPTLMNARNGGRSRKR